MIKSLLQYAFPMRYHLISMNQAEAILYYVCQHQNMFDKYCEHMNAIHNGQPSPYRLWAQSDDYSALPCQVKLYRNWFNAWTLHVDIDFPYTEQPEEEYVIDYLVKAMQKELKIDIPNVPSSPRICWEWLTLKIQDNTCYHETIDHYRVTGEPRLGSVHAMEELDLPFF